MMVISGHPKAFRMKNLFKPQTVYFSSVVIMNVNKIYTAQKK